MSKELSHRIFLVSMFMLLGELFVSFGLFFQPSWAIGWPFGIQQEVALRIGTIGMLFTVIATLFALVLGLYGTKRSEER